MLELRILIGLPASGKSTLAAAWQAEDPDARIVINYDRMRLARYGPDWRWNRKDEDAVKANARRIATEALTAGLSVCIDNTNLSARARQEWIDLGGSLGTGITQEYTTTSRAECIRRDALREGKARVGRAVIDRMALQYGLLDWTKELCVVYPDGFGRMKQVPRPIAVVDLDGTIADCSKRLHYIRTSPHAKDCAGQGDSPWPLVINNRCRICDTQIRKDWDSFFAEVDRDEPIAPIVTLVRRLALTHAIVILSGRDTSCGIKTEDWLAKHCDFPIAALFLRKPGDHRPSWQHKLEIIAKLPKEQVEYIFEDRDAEVKAYREAGYRVLQVCDGSY